MKNGSTLCKIALLLALLAAGAGLLLRQHRKGAQLQNQIADLNREKEQLAPSGAAQRSPDTSPARTPTTPEHPAAPTAAPFASGKSSNVAPKTPVATPTGPETGMTAVEDFQYAGRATPTAAFQTFVWAALSGNDTELANTLALRGTGREKMVELWASLPPESRTKFPTPESIPATYAAEQMIRKLQSIRFLETRMTDENHADLLMRITNRSGRTSDQDPLPLIREGGEWRVLLPDNMVEIIRKKLGGQTTAQTGR